MEQDSPGRSTQLRDEDFDFRGARKVSKLQKLDTERTQTTTSRSVTTDGHQGTTHYVNGKDSMPLSSSPEILINDDEDQWTSAAADASDEWRSRKTERHLQAVEQRSGTQEERYDTEERRATPDVLRSDMKEQTGSTQSLSRRERNVAAAEMAYRMVGLPADIEYHQVSKRSKTVDTDGRSKPRGGLCGLEDTADFIVEDAMEQAIEAMYGKKRRRKTVNDVRTSSTGETRSLDRLARTTTTTDKRSIADYDTTLAENRALGQTINETTSRDESRKKAVSYLRVEKDDEDIDQDFRSHRPASADGRLTNRAHYAVRKAQAAQRRAPLKSRYEVTYASPTTSRYQRQTAKNLLASQRVSGYSSETELVQSSRRPERRQHFSGDDSDFSTTVEVTSPRSTQFHIETGGYTSDDDDSRNLHFSSSQSRVPTLTKGMVTKILHGDRPQSPTADTFVSDRRFDVQPTALPAPVHFSASPPTTISVLSSPTVHRDSQLSAVVPVGTATDSRSAFRPSAFDDNFLLQRAPAYQTRVDAARYFARQAAVYEGGGTGRSIPASLQAMVENDERPFSSYAAFSNEPIIVANLDDDIMKTTSMRRAQSLIALDEVRPASAGGGRSQTPNYSSRPDIRMTNRQVLNLYLFNRPPGEGGKSKPVELETVTRSMTFDEEVQNKQTQTTTSSPIYRETTHYVTRQRNVEKVSPPMATYTSKYIQADTEQPHPKPSKRRKPAHSRVTEETVIMKPSITETRETEMVGDVFADRHRILQPEPVITRSTVAHVRDEPPQEEPEEEILETTVVEEKEQRIEMTIREDLEFSLQRSKGTAKAVAGSTEEGKVEPWWIPDTFEAFVERKRQKVTETKDVENKDDHSKRIDIEYDKRNSQDICDASNFDTNFENQSTSRYNRQDDRNARIPIFLESHYNSPLHGMTSPSSNLVRTKMATHSEPQLNRRREYYTRKRDKYYGSLFDDSHSKPFATDKSSNENSLTVTSSHVNKRQRTPSADIPELRLEVVDDEASDDSAATESRPVEKRYVSTYSQYISPPLGHGGNILSSWGNDDFTPFRPETDTRASRQPLTSGMGGTGTVFPTSKIISMPDVEPEDSDSASHGPDVDQLPESLEHFDRVLTEIEEDLPLPPAPLPLPASNQRMQNTSSQHRYIIKSPSNLSADTPPTHRPTKSKPPPPPPEKSWKCHVALPPKSGKLYSSEDHSANATMSGREKQKSTASKSEWQSTGLKATDKEITPASIAEASRHQATGEDFHHELGDRSYISLALTEPVQSEDHHRRIAVVRRGQLAEPGGFSYGWTSTEQRKREHAPGSYQIRHSRSTTKDYETAATAF